MLSEREINPRRSLGMSQVQTRQMGRLTAAGTLDKLDDALSLLARLKALHFIDYDGSEDDLSLGKPNDKAEEIAKLLNKTRAAAAQVEPSGPSKAASLTTVRKSIDEGLEDKVDTLLGDLSRMDEIENSISSQSEEESVLSLLSPLGIDIELLSGYESITSFVGTVDDLKAAETAAGNGMFVSGTSGKTNVVAVFVRNDDADSVSSALSEAGYAEIQLPEGSGDPSSRMNELMNQRLALQSEGEEISNSVSNWVDDNGEELICGLEVLERDHELITSPVKVAVSAHAFVIDGWVEMDRSADIKVALGNICTVVDVEPFVIQAGGAHHDHDDEHHEPEMPPIAYQPRSTTKPMELVTDMVGRPGYGRLDPTVFMFFTYPIFFGVMLGDMAYGLATVGLGTLLYSRAGTNDTLKLGGRFLQMIGVSTLIFGYLYAEIAGFEIFLYEKMTYADGSYMKDAAGHYMYTDNQSPVAFLSALYFPFDIEHGYGWEASYGFSLSLAFPFHRVGSHMTDLIIISLYMGCFHVLLGLIMGFRDILLVGNGHGGVGLVAAFFEKGVWMILMVGGFMFAHGFLGSYDELLLPGVSLIAFSTICLIWTLYRYHGLDLFVAVLMGPVEAIGLMPTVISYVRLFAVGIVGVKIAETGNHMFFDKISMDEPLMAVLLIIGWLLVQAFAWLLGVFSPNIHAARLHMVEWMKQYYDSSGQPFSPFGGTSQYVEGE